MPSPLLSSTDVAEWLGVSPRYVTQNAERLQGIRIARKWHFRQEMIEKVLSGEIILLGKQST